MFLNKYNSESSNEDEKNKFNNIYPFSFFKVSKVRNSFLKQMISYEEKEKEYMTLYGFRMNNNNNKKIIKRNKRKNKIKNFPKSLSSSSVISNLKKIFSLNFDKKNTFYQVNPFNLQILPHIKRNIRKYDTHISINTNNINNIKFDNSFLNKMINKKRNITSKNLIFKSTKSPFITDIKEIKETIPNNSKSKNKKNKVSTNLILSELLSGNIENNKLSKNNFLKFNNHFSFNKPTSININSPKSLKLNSFSSTDLKIKSNECTPLFERNLIIKSIKNQRNKDKDTNKNERNTFSSLKSQDSDISSVELRSITNFNNNNKIFNNENSITKNNSKKDKKKVFNSLFKNKIFNLQNEIDKCSKEHEKNEDEYKLYIKYMIKKCKHIYDVIDTNFTHKIRKSDYNIKQNEKLNSGDKDNKNKKRKAELRYQILKNGNKIYNLVNENNQLNKRMINTLQKFLEKSNPTN